ncbi:hypothetical protein Dsin_016714 [Dipteronia sinensis]|uniref:SNRNP25 ubiquitin-like domain-containing protein n=1 Tax=Dipteronia sinensis TaxID=43782 RepID=A0AAE0AEK9_9ROSI|nr:hypothetical protein Dsin_016714 [Dipteronia sinensis]
MMLRLATGEFTPRVSVDGPRFSSALSFSSLMMDGLSRKSVSYDKLPEEPINLSVRKLDGSCFDIQVSKTATVGELKMAVEAAFCHMPRKGPGKISWPHVWGHFCLCFEGQKLVTDTDYIKKFYIKDGDQLQFIRHISSSCNLTKKRSKKRDPFSREQDESLSPSSSCIEREQVLNKREDFDCDDMENGRYWHYDNNDESIDGEDESRFVHCWRVCVPKRKSKSFSARFDCGFFCSIRRLLQFCEGKHYTQTEASREDIRLNVWRED